MKSENKEIFLFLVLGSRFLSKRHEQAKYLKNGQNHCMLMATQKYVSKSKSMDTFSEREHVDVNI
jgi:hypothetical protein